MSAEPNQLTLPAVPEAQNGMVAMMERLALNPDLPVEKLEKLLEMQIRVRAIEAETAFNAAMTSAQSEMRRVAADANNPQTNSKYASYGQLDRALRPIYTKHGFSVSFDEGQAPSADVVLALAYVSHAGGHTRTYRKTMPIVTTGIKGNAMMTATHGTASAGSYAKRYLLKDIFNVAIGEDDDDGNGPGVTLKVNEDQAANLEALLTEVGANREKFLAYFKAPNVEGIAAGDYVNAVRQLEKKRRG